MQTLAAILMFVVILVMIGIALHAARDDKPDTPDRD